MTLDTTHHTDDLQTEEQSHHAHEGYGHATHAHHGHASHSEHTPTAQGATLVRGLAVLAFLVAVGAVLTAMVYLRSPEDAFVQKITSVLPYPAAFVSWRPITMHDYFVERTAVEKYLTSTNPGAPLPEGLDAQILETLINKEAMEAIAASHHLGATKEEIDEQYKNAIGDMEESAFVAQIHDSLGWTPEQFKSRILRSVVLADDVGAWVSSDKETQAEPRSRVDAAYARLGAGEDFAVVAGDASEDTATAANGGDLGFLSSSEIPEAWAADVTATETGKYTPVIETDNAFLIFKVTDRVVAEGDDNQVRLSVIVIQKKTLDDVVGEYLQTVKVRKLIQI